MTTYTYPQLQEYEKTVLSIMRRLPVERLPNLIDYARFLEFQEGLTSDDTVSDRDARWDAMLASSVGKALLYKLADAAEVEIDAGRTTDIGFTDDGRLAQA